MHLRLFITTSILIIMAYIPLLANEKSKKDEKPEKKNFEFNQTISTWIDKQAKALDLALSGAKYTNDQEDSQAIISQEVFWVEGEDFKYKLDFDLNLALPNLQKKYKILFSNYNRNEIRRSNYSRRKFRDDASNNYGATLAFFQKIGKFDVTFEPRLKIANPIATFYNLRLESLAKKKSYSLKTRIEFFADSKKGTGQFTSLTLRKTFWDRWAHALVAEEEYQDAQNLFSTLQAYSLNFQINESLLLTQSFIFSFNNKPNYHLYDISIGPSFTHIVLPDEIEYSINYTQFFNEDYDFKGRNSASIIVRVIF